MLIGNIPSSDWIYDSDKEGGGHSYPTDIFYMDLDSKCLEYAPSNVCLERTTGKINFPVTRLPKFGINPEEQGNYIDRYFSKVENYFKYNFIKNGKILHIYHWEKGSNYDLDTELSDYLQTNFYSNTIEIDTFGREPQPYKSLEIFRETLNSNTISLAFVSSHSNMFSLGFDDEEKQESKKKWADYDADVFLKDQPKTLIFIERGCQTAFYDINPSDNRKFIGLTQLYEGLYTTGILGSISLTYPWIDRDISFMKEIKQGHNLVSALTAYYNPDNPSCRDSEHKFGDCAADRVFLGDPTVELNLEN